MQRRTAETTESRTGEFQELVEAFGPSLRRMVGVYEFDRSLQDDLVQEILVALWRGLALYRGESRLSTWVYRVAHNVALKHRRSRGRARDRQAEFESDQLARAANRVDVDASAKHSAIDELRRHIAALPAPERQLVVLHLEGLSSTEIAEVMGLSSTNVSTRLTRVRAKLGRASAARSSKETHS